MKFSRPLRELVQVAMMSSLIGGISIKILERPKDAKTAEIISEQRKMIGDLQGKVEMMGQGGFNAGEKGNDDVLGCDAKEICVEEAEKCENERIGRFSKDLYTCTKLFEGALHIRDMRKEVSCTTARRIHSLVETGLERCDDAVNETSNQNEKDFVLKEKRKLIALQRDPKISPSGCVRRSRGRN